MKLSRLIELTGLPALHMIGPDVDITGLTDDSRRVVQGSLFAALPSTRSLANGSSFIAMALSSGAVAILHNGTLSLGADLAQLIHPEPRYALAFIASAFCSHPARDLNMIAVTGSNGKTTVAAMVEAILQTNGIATGVMGTTGIRHQGHNLPSPLTTPDPITLHLALRHMVDQGCQACVAEVSSHALTQFRTAGIHWQAAAFTNLTRDHLDYHGSMEYYWQAKLRLFQDLPHPDQAIVNLDDPKSKELIHLAASLNIPILGFAQEYQENADFFARDLSLHWTQTRFLLATPGGSVPITLAVGGRFNVANALTAAALCWSLGLDKQAIQVGLTAFRSVRGRMEPIQAGQPFTVIVDFAHTPDALERLLVTARAITLGKCLLVFGCGGDRDAGKRIIMGQIAGQLADAIMLTDDNPRSEDPDQIRQTVKTGLQGVQGHFTEIPARELAIEHALNLAQPGDVVLIAGKGHETVQITATGTYPFDDAQVARECLSRMGYSRP